METEAAEHSPAPSTSTNKLKAVFSKARRGNKDKDNASSLSINDADSTASGSRGLRASFDATIDKIKTRASGEQDEVDSSESAGIAKLIPARIKKKRRRREAEAAQQEAEELRRGRSIGERGGVGDGTHGTSPYDATPSRDKLDGDDDGSSLITYDSDIEP